MNFTTLNLNKDFRRIYGRGRSYISPQLVTYVMPKKNGGLRIGITTSKKIGCAVKRNRARRVIMAAWRNCLPQVNGNYDFVFVARVKTTLVKSTDIERAMKRHLSEAGVI